MATLTRLLTNNGGTTPAGTVIAFASSTAPAGFVKCNGAALNRTAYADLFSVTGTTFGAGDGSTTFNVPDLRGEFIRGWDDSRGVDSGRSFGSAQGHMLANHTHSFQYYRPGFSYQGHYSPNYMANSEYLETRTTADPNGGGPYGAETRPRNVALLYCIKY
jgi:microcystin-dependent protein